MKKVTLHDKTFSRIISFSEIESEIVLLADILNGDYGDSEPPIFIPVLNGSFMFAAELLKKIEFGCEVSFIKLASYNNEISTGTVSEIIGLGTNIEGRDIIVIEDIIETGLTIEVIDKLLRAQNPLSIKYMSLFFKPECYEGNIEIDYKVFEITNDFIVGFGLDYNGLGRNLKDIYSLEQ